MEMATRNSKVGLVAQKSISRYDSTIDAEISLHQFARTGDVGALEQVLSQRHIQVRVDDLDDNGMSPLHYAARFNDLDVAKVLIEKGHAKASIRDWDGATPLHYCARKKQRGQSKESADLIHMLAYLTDVNIHNNRLCTPLHFAAMRGNEVAARALLECEDVDVDATDNTGCTPLHSAAIYNEVGVAHLLIDHGAFICSYDKEARSPLHYACIGEDNAKMVRLLMDRTKEEHQNELIDAKDQGQNTALHLAIDARNTPAVQLLLNRGAGVNERCRLASVGYTPLHLAAMAGDVDMIRLLLEQGALLLALDYDRSTPLHTAVECQNEEAVRFFLRKIKTTLESRDKNNCTALLEAASGSSATILKSLLDAGADTTALDRHDRSVLHLAAKHNKIELIKVLLKYAENSSEAPMLDEEDMFGDTPLHLACRRGATEIVSLLLDIGADISVKNEKEDTPFLVSAKSGHVSVVKLILKTSQKVLNDQDEYSNTALHLAAENGHMDVVKLLVDTGADKEFRNDKLWNPLDLAAAHGHEEIVTYLLRKGVPANPIVDTEKEPPLMLAARNGHEGVVSILIRHGANVRGMGNRKDNCLDAAIDLGERDVALAIINSDQWETAMMHESSSDGSRITPMRKLINRMPDVAEVALNRCISPLSNVPYYDYNYYIEFNYVLLDDTYFDYDQDLLDQMIHTEDQYDQHNVYGRGYPYDKNKKRLKENHSITIMIDKKRAALLTHPLMVALSRHKWSAARPLYFTFLIFYFIFLSLITAYMVIAEPPFNRNWTACEQPGAVDIRGDFERGATIAIWVFAAFGLIIEIIQCIAERWLYLKVLNTLDLFTYISSIIIVTEQTNCGARTDWQWKLGAFCLFVAWINMLMFLRRVPVLGLYTVMVTTILKTFAKFFVVFFLFIVAFALTFYILLQNQVHFSSPFESIIKSSTMMLGEFTYDDIFHGGIVDPASGVHFRGVTYAIFCLFLILMAVIVNNLLTGLAVEDVGKLQKHSLLRKMAIQLDLALDIEFSIPGRLRKYFKYSIAKERFYPNRHPFFLTKYLGSLLDGPIMSQMQFLQYYRKGNIRTPMEELEHKLERHIKTSNKYLNDMREEMEEVKTLLRTLVDGDTKENTGQGSSHRSSSSSKESTSPEATTTDPQ